MRFSTHLDTLAMFPQPIIDRLASYPSTITADHVITFDVNPHVWPTINAQITAWMKSRP